MKLIDLIIISIIFIPFLLTGIYLYRQKKGISLHCAGCAQGTGCSKKACSMLRPEEINKIKKSIRHSR